MSVYLVRALVDIRAALRANTQMARKLEVLELPVAALKDVASRIIARQPASQSTADIFARTASKCRLPLASAAEQCRAMTHGKHAARSVEVAPRIHLLRGHRVMLDSDLAALYGLPTFRLNEAVKRNQARFPPDFSFVLTKQELANLTSQIAISSLGTAAVGHFQSRLRSMAPSWLLPS